MATTSFRVEDDAEGAGTLPAYQQDGARPAERATTLKVAVVVPIRDEIARLPTVLANIERQTLPAQQVIFVDGRSEDGSGEWLRAAARSRPWLTVVDNPERIIPTAMNRGVAELDSDVMARMDAHVDYESNYLEEIVGVLQRHPELAGAGAPYATKGRGPWGETIAAVLRQPWVHGGANHRDGTTPGPARHTSCTAYRIAAVRAAGGWDTRMLANEDEEMDLRVRRFGDIWLVPTTRSTWYVRQSPQALARQMWRYGYFRTRTIHLHPEALRLRVLAPPTLTFALTAGLVLKPRWGLGLLASYLAAAGTLGAVGAKRDGASAWRGALTPPIVHLVYGAGFLFGLWDTRGARPDRDHTRFPPQPTRKAPGLPV